MPEEWQSVTKKVEGRVHSQWTLTLLQYQLIGKFKDNMGSWDPISKESNSPYPQKKLITILVERLKISFRDYYFLLIK